jgi:hypothetical protein
MASGRSGTGAWRYRHNRAAMLAASDVCWLCGHGGARTADHIITAKDWPPGVPGFDDVTNLAPAHGTSGSGRDRIHNRCPEPNCQKLCNQSRGARWTPGSLRSVDW